MFDEAVFFGIWCGYDRSVVERNVVACCTYPPPHEIDALIDSIIPLLLMGCCNFIVFCTISFKV